MRYCVRFMCVLLLFTLIPAFSCAEVILYACHTEGELRIRDEPWGDKVGYLFPGDSVEFVEEKNGWTHIKCSIESGGGWVKSEFLTVDPNASGSYINSSGGRVHVRKTPEITSKNHKRWLESGDTVFITYWSVDKDGNEWGFVGDGYVLKDCMTKVEETED